MGIQDDAFDIEHYCKGTKRSKRVAKRFIKYTWALEEEVGELRRKLHNLDICLNILKERGIVK